MKKYLLLLLCAFVAACGSAPTVRDSKVLDQRSEKIHSLRFCYKGANMTSKSTSYGKGATIADTGFNEFGSILAERAANDFAKVGVAVIESKTIGANDAISVDASVAGAGGVKLPILVITPVSGKSHSNGKMTSTSYVFSAMIIDPEMNKAVWRATIDTSTWTGQDIVMRQMKATAYDDEYADQLFKAVIEKMRADSVI